MTATQRLAIGGRRPPGNAVPWRNRCSVRPQGPTGPPIRL